MTKWIWTLPLLVLLGCGEKAIEPTQEDDFAGSMSFDTYTHTREGTGYLRLQGEDGGAHLVGLGSVLIKDLVGTYDFNEHADIVFEDEDAILIVSDSDSLEAEVWADGSGTVLVQGRGFAEWFGNPLSKDDYWTAEYIDE